MSDALALLPSANRFFARIHGSFDCECPKCGRMYRISRGVRLRRELTAARAGIDVTAYDPRTQRFRCMERGCGGCFTVGLLFWPRSPGQYKGLPLDQIPNLRQLADLRREGGGWWMPERSALPAPLQQPLPESNLALGARYLVESNADEDDVVPYEEIPDQDRGFVVLTDYGRRVRGLPPLEDEE